MLHGIRVQRVFLLDGSPVCQVNAVVIPLPQHPGVKQGFEPSETVPQGELIQAVGFEFRLVFLGKDRSLSQRPAFRFRNLFTRDKPCPERQRAPEGQHKYGLILFHGATSESEIQEGAEGAVHQIGGADEQQPQPENRLQGLN